MRDAALAASEGRKDDAVYALRQALRWSDVPIRYAPEPPWFRSLEGYAPYDALHEEFEQRVRRARDGMLALDATLPAELRR